MYWGIDIQTQSIKITRIKKCKKNNKNKNREWWKVETSFKEFIVLFFNKQIKTNKKNIIKYMIDYLKVSNNSMQYRNTIINYIDYWQVQIFTGIVKNILE
jgi:hypothetical protein